MALEILLLRVASVSVGRRCGADGNRPALALPRCAGEDRGGSLQRRVNRLRRPPLNTYRLHPTDFIIGYIERYLSDRRFTILSSNEASGLGRLIGRRRMQCWVAAKRLHGASDQSPPTFRAGRP